MLAKGTTTVGPPGQEEKPDWVDQEEGAIGSMVNTFGKLERPFLDHLANRFKKPAWGVGSRPEKCWKSYNGSVVTGGEVRGNGAIQDHRGRCCKMAMDSKPCGSVLNLPFGCSTLSLTP